MKKAEEEVLALKDQLAQRATDKYHDLFNSIDEGFCIIEKVRGDGPLDFVFVETNPAFEAHTGAADVVGKTIREAFPLESEEWFLIYDTIVRTGEHVKFERGMDSQERTLELYAFRIKDETSRRVGIVFRDITERKKAEQKIRESKELMEGIAETIPDMISVQEYPSRKIIYSNRAPFSMNGFDPDEMKKMAVEERHTLIHPEDIDHLRKYADGLAGLSDEDVATLEYRSKSKTNDWMWLRVRTKVFERDQEGKVKSIVNIIQNITAKKQVEEELTRYTAELKKSKDLLQSIIDSSLSTIRVFSAVRDERDDIIDLRIVLKKDATNEDFSGTIGKLFRKCILS